MIISFIIPTYNEEKFIGRNLSAIDKYAKNIEHEIIVVDNGSADNTINIVKQFDVTLLVDASKTIAGLRNLGSIHAKGQILIFLDADVMLTQEWSENIAMVLETIIKPQHGPIITGSRCGVPNNPSWVEKYWFSPMRYEKARYINSGHLIIEKNFFDRLGGFCNNLITAEDYELCLRAKKYGALLKNNPALHVIHEGYPKTILNFIRREIWHGSQDYRFFSSFIKSKIAIVSILYCFVLFLGIMLLFLKESFCLFSLCLVINLLIAFLSALRKRMSYPLNVGAYFLLYNIYFLSRGLSLFRSRWS